MRLWRAAAAWLLVAVAMAAAAQPTVLPMHDIVEALRPLAKRELASAPPSLALAIDFEPNSSRVRPSSGPVLGNLVAALLTPELKASRFVIEGHSDARGAASADQRLSQDRADEVRLYLVALGVPAARLRAVGKGAVSEPAKAADPLAAPALNVRVVVLE